MTNPLDFSKIETLRKQMLLTVCDMASLLGASRMAYYSWVRGKPPRPNRDTQIRLKLKKLLAVMSDHSWPTPEVIGMTQKQRKERLDKILEQYQ